MNWEDKLTVKKGNLGESIVKNYLEKKGYVVYKSISDLAHAFDFLIVKDKKIILIAEVKTKARMNKYNSTGINLKHYNEYIYIQEKYNINIILFFVDEHPKEKRVYYQTLKNLSLERVVKESGKLIKYPNCEIIKGVILFSLIDMEEVCKLSDNQINDLKKYSSRSYGYE